MIVMHILIIEKIGKNCVILSENVITKNVQENPRKYVIRDELNDTYNSNLQQS